MNLKCGTPGYIAPEILLNKKYGPKVDVFSIGIMTYILISGRSPFQSVKPEEVLLENKIC